MKSIQCFFLESELNCIRKSSFLNFPSDSSSCRFDIGRKFDDKKYIVSTQTPEFDWLIYCYWTSWDQSVFRVVSDCLMIDSQNTILPIQDTDWLTDAQTQVQTGHKPGQMYFVSNQLKPCEPRANIRLVKLKSGLIKSADVR